MRSKTISIAAAVLALGASAVPADGQSLFGGGKVSQQGGKAIYQGVCQTCHMPDGHGAKGAGQYPALANNEKLAVAGYPLSVIIHGQKAMPALGSMLTDQQVADVANYIRTSFGNQYTDSVSDADAKAAR